MDKAVAQLNIEHYRKLLSTETDSTKRTTLERLLAEEEAKLTTLMNNVGPKALKGASPRRIAVEGEVVRLGRRPPFTPVGRAHVDALIRACIDPSTPHSAAGKRQRVRTALIQDGEFEIVIERRGVDGLPLH